MFGESSGEGRRSGCFVAVVYTDAARGPTARHSLRSVEAHDSQTHVQKILLRSSITGSTYDIFQNHQHVCNLIHLERTGVHTLHRNSNYWIIFYVFLSHVIKQNELIS